MESVVQQMIRFLAQWASAIVAFLALRWSGTQAASYCPQCVVDGLVGEANVVTTAPRRVAEWTSTRIAVRGIVVATSQFDYASCLRSTTREVT